MTTAVLPLLGAWAVAVVSPGPDFVITLRTAAADTRRAGLWVATGVVSGIACWAVLALLGLTTLLDRYQHLYQAVRAAGACFLIYYGATTLWRTWRQRAEEAPDPVGVRAGAGAGAGTRTGSALRHWRLGLLTNLANPKAVVFFGALFAGLLPAGTGAAERVLLLAVMLAMALAWFGLVALAVATPLVTGAYRRARRAVDTVTGGVFAGVGAALMPR